MPSSNFPRTVARRPPRRLRLRERRGGVFQEGEKPIESSSDHTQSPMFEFEGCGGRIILDGHHTGEYAEAKEVHRMVFKVFVVRRKVGSGGRDHHH